MMNGEIDADWIRDTPPKASIAESGKARAGGAPAGKDRDGK
jgi:hypothetical protein